MQGRPMVSQKHQTTQRESIPVGRRDPSARVAGNRLAAPAAWLWVMSVAVLVGSIAVTSAQSPPTAGNRLVPPPVPVPPPVSGLDNPAAATGSTPPVAQPRIAPPRVAQPPIVQPPASQPPASQPPVRPLPQFRSPVAVPGARPAAALQTVTMAVTGTPYGVARIEIPLAEALRDGPLPPLEVTDSQQRILYPVTRDIQAPVAPRPRQLNPADAAAIGNGRLLRRIGDLVRDFSEEPGSVTVAREVIFLFHGDQPLRVQLSIPDVAGRTELLLTPAPAASANTHSQVLTQWWRAYTAALQRQIDQADYPPIVESYLIALLSGRLDLPLPDGFLEDATQGDASVWSTLDLIAGTEAIQTSILRRAAAGVAGPADIAHLPLPEAPRWAISQSPAVDPTEPAAELPPADAPAAEAPQAADQAVAELEPAASRVPPECFYLRFGSFANYIWFRDLSEEYGGDISRMVTLRGVENDSAKRLEGQLILQTSELSRILGESVIEDQVLMGRDLFLADGASLGVLFRARNMFLLRRSLDSDRNARLAADPSLTQQMVRIEGQDVPFISSPDNRVRSFLAVDGNYIFVSNSETLVKRFFEVGRGGQSLAQTPEFRLARQLLPLARNDSVFAYFSPEMLRGLVGPDYLIELRRRLQSSAEMALVRIARLAAAAESQPLWEIDDLVDAGFLPLGFGHRADGSGLITVGEQMVDSLRGRAGSFLPIADVVTQAVTADEDQWYRSIAEYHSTQWRQMDPIMMALRRSAVPDVPDLERLDVHVEVAPWSPDQYGSIARQLGPPTRVKIDFAPDDIIAAQAHVVSDQLGGSIPPHHLFAAIKDTVPPTPEQFDGILKTYGTLRSLPGYVGAWPFPGVLDRLPLGLGRGQPAGPGMTRLVGGLYRFQGGGFSVLSFQPEILQSSLPHIVADEADDLAQVRIRAGNLAGSQLESWANTELYQRAAASSRAGADLLGLLTRQLRVDRTEALATASLLLGGNLQDPLGGSYVLASPEKTVTHQNQWVSTAWPNGVLANSPPPDYLAPVLGWFRGGQASVTQLDDRISADIQIDVRRQALIRAAPTN